MIDEIIEELRNRYPEEIVHVEVRRQQRGLYLKPAAPLPCELSERLAAKGIDALYRHQALALDTVRSGENIIVLAGASSGKSLCYNLPVIEALSDERKSRALYVFPAKALTQDQLKSQRELSPKRLISGIYDGDTPNDQKQWIRKNARILFTNPDMLHFGILPNHTGWGDFFLNLRYIVLDEAHVYRGIFGANVGLVIRRLRRLCENYGGKPQFIVTTATLSNPLELASNITGLDFKLIDEDTSFASRKYIAFWNPAIEKGIRSSSNADTVKLLLEMVQRGFRTLVFCKSRNNAELIAKYAREHLAGREKELISPYRGGYTAAERREIEKDLFEGKLLGVSSTSALELGIDIGDLDAVIINGFPGTISSFWQQAGRSGRRSLASLVILVALDDPLDQYYVTHPEFLLDKSHEAAIFNVENPYVLAKHLFLAAAEKPLSKYDERYFGSGFKEAVSEMVNSEKLKERKSLIFPGTVIRREDLESIRTSSADDYLIAEAETGNLIGTIDSANAFLDVHPGAVYLHRAEQYLIKQLDLKKKVALAERAAVDYYTQPKELTDLKIIKILSERKTGRTVLGFGKVEVTLQVTAYQQKKNYTGETLAVIDLELPPVSFATEASWFVIGPEIIKELKLNDRELAGGIHAVEHGAIALLPLFALCDRWDIGGVSTPFHYQLENAAVFIYDGVAGGTGIAKKGFEVFEEHMKAAHELIRNCRCEDGCPACVQSPKCGNWNEPLNKSCAIRLIAALIER